MCIRDSLATELGDRVIQEVQVGQDAVGDQGVMAPKWPDSAAVSSGIFGRSLPLASSASAPGSPSPSISAWIIARADWVNTFEATEVSLMPC